MRVDDVVVWKENFLVDGDPITLEGFLDKFFTFIVRPRAMDFTLFHFRLIHFKDIRAVYNMCLHLDEKRFPKHFVFANFQCLRCGLCCKNYESIEVYREQIEEWELEGREDILKHVWALEDNGRVIYGEVFSSSWRGCPFCRKVTGKPYYYCRIQAAKKNIPVCKAYLCSKSVPVAHLNYKDVEELIELIGVSGYYALIERDWDEEYDYSRCELKTHKKLTDRPNH
jgi:hypothetical protein